MQFDLALDPSGRSATFSVCGELDLYTSADLHAGIDALATGAAQLTAVILDLQAVTFADSSALHMLLRLHQFLGDRLVIRTSAAVHRVLEVSGLLATFTVA